MQATVLVVDDHDLVRNLIAEILASAGFTVLEASGGQAAIDIVRECGDSIDCVLQDMSMPGMSGPETIAGLQAIIPDIRIIVLSVDQEPLVRQELGDLSVLGYLEKPCDTQQLLDTVGAAVG